MSNGRRLRRKLAKAVAISPSIPDDASPALKDALAIRNAASASGTCPECGAVLELVDGTLKPGTISWAVMSHDDGCPATDDNVRHLVRTERARRAS